MVNRVILLGNLGADPELRYTQSSTAICSFRLATSRRRKNQDGEYVEETQWHSVIAWAKLAESCERHLHKGSKVFVDGRIEYREYEKDGARRFITEIVAQDVRFLDPRERQAGAGQAPAGESQAAQGQMDMGGSRPQAPVDPDDLPF